MLYFTVQDCKIDLLSYATDSAHLPPWMRHSFIKINGESVYEEPFGDDTKSLGHGFRLVRINNDCSVNETLIFGTPNDLDYDHRYLDDYLDKAAIEMRDYLRRLPELPRNARFAGIINHKFTNVLREESIFHFFDNGIDLRQFLDCGFCDTPSHPTSLCFVFTTGKPQQSKLEKQNDPTIPAMLQTTI